MASPRGLLQEHHALSCPSAAGTALPGPSPPAVGVAEVAPTSGAKLPRGPHRSSSHHRHPLSGGGGGGRGRQGIGGVRGGGGEEGGAHSPSSFRSPSHSSESSPSPTPPPSSSISSSSALPLESSISALPPPPPPPPPPCSPPSHPPSPPPPPFRCALHLFLVILHLLLLASAGSAHVDQADDTSEFLIFDEPEDPGEEYLPTKAPKCDKVMRSTKNGHRSGMFSSPFLPNFERHSQQCMYTFIASPEERVFIRFTQFRLRGTPPDGTTLGVTPACNHEYLDLYTEIEDSENFDLLHTPFGGRYCGHIGPRLRISLYQTIVLTFYTDLQNTTSDLFHGVYKFINKSKYTIGKPVKNHTCGFEIHSDMVKNGTFMSPTYPGVYPKNITCYYKFLGHTGQRIRLEFRDFDLFFGGPHCPFDQIKMYDGPNTTAPLIGTYCGQQRNLVIFSRGSSLYVNFTTLQRAADAQNRGFQGIFNFSESYLGLDFIKSDSEHIRGTECDQRILSKGTSNGTIFSPGYPFPYAVNIVCRYFIYGLYDVQNLERVRLQFSSLNIPAVPRGYKNCTDGYLRIYLKGQEEENAYDKPDHEFCGQSPPPTVVSSGPRLFILFKSGNQQGIKFKANYRFETEYKIPGTPAPDGSCEFTYKSSSQKKRGSFNSPRHPGNYPSNTTCKYTFMPGKKELVKVVFDQFKVRTSTLNYTYGIERCQDDYVEIYNLYKPDKQSGTTNWIERLNGRYCGFSAPGPISSERDSSGLMVILRTDKEGVYSGFNAKYKFLKREELFSDCGENITSTETNIITSGIITSPHWPNNYDNPKKTEGSFMCDWFISVRPNHRVYLWLQSFAVEGDPDTRGCPAAVLRAWPDLDKVPREVCGETLTPKNSVITSKNSLLRLSFITADKSVGAKGFKAIWTEIKDGPNCDAFLCKKNNLCISIQQRCDGVHNCGDDDSSDEENCAKATEVNVLMLVGVCLGISSVVLIVICIWCHRKRVRRRQDGPVTIERHVCPGGVARFASTDSMDRSLSPVLGARKAQHHLSRTSLRTETVV
ncbi:cubilin-like isoform X2 [Oratosquilla oratoria]|uniref:cubilin-like isoform X2 n=1 Tax=Oratosquilla oratoria TaxID=337810 RepID=UPI003F776A19